ncbi:hypothetical protein [Hyphomonas sp.]|uniref:phage tail protein n=1 Tax=Hyphomonas sp. TaxID=87 RepID=UPI0025BA3CF3|nr:hypothetical protein [Hyphomonas sp.]
MAGGRNVISQSIRLEGGEEILRQLRSLGEEGERSAQRLQQAFGRVALGNSFAAQFARLRMSFGELTTAGARVATSFTGLTRGLSDVGTAFSYTTSRIALFTAAAVGAAYAATRFFAGALNRADELGDLASSLGVTATQLQSLQAAAKVAGVEAGTLNRGFISIGEALSELQAKTQGATSAGSDLNDALGQTAGSTVKVIGGFDSYGAAAAKSAGETKKLSESARALAGILNNVGLKPGQILPIDAFRAVADQFARMQDGALKTGLAVDLFGKRIGPSLIPLLNMGSTGIAKYEKVLADLGLTATNASTEIAGKATDELAFVGFLFEQYANKFATLVAPAIINATDAILNALRSNSGKISAILQQMAAALSSVIVDVVNVISGLDDASIENKWLLDIRDAALAVRDTFVNVLIPAFQLIRNQAQLVASAFNLIFGTQLTGDAVLIGALVLKLVGGFRLLFSIVNVGVQAIMLLVNALRFIGPLGATISMLFQTIAAGIGLAVRLLPALAAFLSPTGLIAAGVIALGVVLASFWDEIVAGATAAFDGLTALFGAVWDGLTAVAQAALSGLTTVVTDTWTGIAAATQAIWAGFTTVWSDLWLGLTTVVSDARAGLIAVVTAIWTGITSTVALAREGLFAAATLTWSAIAEAATGVATLIQPIWDGLVTGATAALTGFAELVLQAWSGATEAVVASAEAIQAAITRATEIAGDMEGAAALAETLVQPFIDAAAQIEQIMGTIPQIAEAGFSAVAAVIDQAAARIQQAIAAILASIRAAIAEAARLRSQGSSGGSGSSSNFASGGYVSGPGSATSDSIPAWLSNGEFVIRAAAVRRYGVQFLAALNGMRLGNSVKGAAPGFALGGLVESFNRSMLNAAPVPVPSLSGAGGASLPGKSFDLVIGNERFSNLFAPEETAERLVRFADARKAHSTGRKPGWYGA